MCSSGIKQKLAMKIILFSLISFLVADCNNTKEVTLPEVKVSNVDLQSDKYEVSVFASGCFWCLEAVFESVEGVAEAISGYAGGSAADANYSDVSSGSTDHAEAVQVFYDPSKVSYETLLIVFFDSQDPTTLNRQGPDRGTQYRSTIFFKNEEEKNASKAFITKLENEKVWKNPIVTTLEPLEKFYPAEDYHQDYERKNPNQPYVKAVSVPRLQKFQAKHPELLKKEH